MRYVACLVALLALAVVGCPRPMPPAPNPTPSPSSADAGTEVTCADVCQRAYALGCPAAEPTPRGASCLEVCQNAVGSGIVTFNLGCKATAMSCAQFDLCN